MRMERKKSHNNIDNIIVNIDDDLYGTVSKRKISSKAKQNALYQCDKIAMDNLQRNERSFFKSNYHIIVLLSL